MIPKCQLSADFIKPIEDGKVPMLLHHVNLIGAKEPYNTFVIKPPLRAIEPPSATPVTAGLMDTKLGKEIYTCIIYIGFSPGGIAGGCGWAEFLVNTSKKYIDTEGKGGYAEFKNSHVSQTITTCLLTDYHFVIFLRSSCSLPGVQLRITTKYVTWVELWAWPMSTCRR